MGRGQTSGSKERVGEGGTAAAAAEEPVLAVGSEEVEEPVLAAGSKEVVAGTKTATGEEAGTGKEAAGTSTALDWTLAEVKAGFNLSTDTV